MINFTPNQETVRRIGRIEQILSDMEATNRLMMPLVKYLSPLAKLDMEKGIPQEGKSVELFHKDWPDQYDEGINRCMGYDIFWI